MQASLFRRVAIIGIGMMGGSLAMAIKKYGLAQEVIGVSKQQASLDKAIEKKAIDKGFLEIPEAVRNADLVVLATPVESIIKLLPTINPHLKRGCIVTDLGSAKVEIVETTQKALSNPSFFVGSHPLVGSHQEGIEFAKAELFENAICIMTPTAQTHQMPQRKIEQLWTTLKCQVKYLSAEKHDEILAAISHLPHVLAYALIETIPPTSLEFATQGLKDMTRIAASSPQMWNDICMVNSRNVLQNLDELVKNLSFLRNAIVNQDRKALMYHFTKAQEKRNQL